MDVHFTDALPTDTEREAVDQILGKPATSWEGAARSQADGHVSLGGREARERRHLLLPVLHAVSDRVGWISEGAINYVCRRLTVPPADAYGVASFYALFSTTPRPPMVLHVCDDIACMTAGAEQLCEELERSVGAPGAPLFDGMSTWLRSPCLGLCDRAPAALFLGPKSEPVGLAAEMARSQSPSGPSSPRGAVAPTNASQIRHFFSGSGKLPLTLSAATIGGSDLRLLRRVGKVDPTSIDAYRAAGGFSSLRRAIELGPSEIIREVTESKLMGRGGAAFPTGRKWEAVAREAARPHYLVCNADESEPGTFKDRVLMEEDPFALIEAMTIAAIAGACEKGYIYIRGEYPLATERLEGALAQARQHNMLGPDILERGIGFDLELRRGAGAYICGEETALFNSIEGFRGEPRNKPPFPVQKGLFGKPTIVNNVETLVNVLDIVLNGGKTYAATGTPDSTGTKLFCVSGHVAKPGLYEVPFGTTLRSLMELAGGVREGTQLQAVLLGGAAGAFVTPDELDTPLTFEGVRAIKASLGSGVVIVFDETTDLKAILLRIAAFFRDESCGQCVPCRVGTVRQEELLHRLASMKPNGSLDTERTLLAEVGQVMRDASICGLGQTASSAIESALAKFNLFAGTRSS
ncbi:MAG: NAD(P)H-dependent oxidoreductase subunit E [Candidatus Eremiobacteraeota bacterium]|nr:NAD(P)H-dependent oxidoreductase subunit E [Candidatus Eremiobacteraeota bacterium]